MNKYKVSMLLNGVQKEVITVARGMLNATSKAYRKLQITKTDDVKNLSIETL